MRLRICVTMLAVTMIATPGKAENDPVLATVQAFSDARTRFDATKLNSLLTPDYVEVSPRGEIDLRPAVLGFYTADKANAAPPMVFSTQYVRRYGDTAVVIGSIEYTIPGPSGVGVKRTIRATYVERRVRGRWLMASTQFTGVPAQGLAQ